MIRKYHPNMGGSLGRIPGGDLQGPGGTSRPTTREGRDFQTPTRSRGRSAVTPVALEAAEWDSMVHRSSFKTPVKDR